MSGPLLLGCLWVVAAAGVSFLPMRAQFAPGLALLIAAPVLIVWIGLAHGWFLAGIGCFAFLSMFRKPLWYLTNRALRRALGRKVAE